MNLKNFSKLELTIFVVLAFCIICTPALLSLHFLPSPFDESSSWLGSAVGGITAPIVGIFSTVLLYITIKLQIQNTRATANGKTLELYYNSLKSAIDSFSYENQNGSNAIYLFFSEFYCDLHKFDGEMESNNHITELKSILEIFKMIIDTANNSDSNEKEAILNLTKHQFLYRYFPRLNMPEIRHDNFAPIYCSHCNATHGLPPDFVTLLCEILKQFGLENSAQKTEQSAS